MNPHKVGPLIKTEHYENVKSYIEIAKEEGCEVVSGHIPEELSRGNYVAPTMLLNAENDMRWYRKKSLDLSLPS